MQRARESFSPHDVAESKFWFSAREGLTNVGGKASAWEDVIGGFVAAQSDDARRPTISGDSLLCTPAKRLINTADNIFTSGEARYLLFAFQSNAADTGGRLMTFRIDGTGGAQWAFGVSFFGGIIYYFTDSIANNVNDGASWDITQPSIVEIEAISGGTPVVRVNGATRGVGGALMLNDEGSTGFIIGASTTVDNGLDGTIWDEYGATPIPSVSDKGKLRSYFAALNGVTL